MKKNELNTKIIFLIIFMVFYNCKNKEEEKALYKEEENALAKRMSMAVPKNFRERLSANTFPKDSVIKVQQEIKQSFIKEFPNSAVSTDILNRSKIGYGKSLTQNLFNLLTRKQQKSKKGKLISKYLELNSEVKLYDQFIDFEMEDIKGEKNKISELRGKYTLLEFWSSTCKPCRASNKDLVNIYKKYQPKGFEIIGISLDNNKERWTNAIKKDKITWKNLSELNGHNNAAAFIYNVNGIPDNFLIDPNGKIIARDLPSIFLEKTLEILIDGKRKNELPFLLTKGNTLQDTIIYIEKRNIRL
ncbi:peroxiredoxin [uncultured Polaribacter sp.]|uniref:peroxiredoxin family protein n=1 Tax=uncultured Polaribacter sp. TaxID=174711 RepID=UPI002607CA47|nr:TlpA disulfide reductase family protein [uncultured Polaribacter sp.]